MSPDETELQPASSSASAEADKALSRLRIVLVGAQHPGNIGAAARAMKVMGLSDLALVAPERYPDPEATARASGADDVLLAARVHDTLDGALSDCTLAIGTSARTRRTQWSLIDVREAALRAVEQLGQVDEAEDANPRRVAIVFGRERSGLLNEELDRCQLYLQVPTNPDYSSLNLAAAVQVVAYELRVAAGHGIAAQADAHEPVAAGDMEGLYGHLYDVLVASGFLDPDEPKLLMRRLRRLFNRAMPDRIEMNILRGALRSLDPRRLPNRQSDDPGKD